MRKKEHEPDLFSEYYQRIIEWESKTSPYYQELEKISEILDEIPHILERIQKDQNSYLGKGKQSKPGRNADITAEQTLRCLILKQLQGYDYRGLAVGIDITPLHRKFTRFYGGKIPHFTTIEKAIKRISTETMELINMEIVKLGIKKKLEKGKVIRHDTTVIQTDIRYPTDAKLLDDSVRVMNRLVLSLVEEVSEIEIKFKNRTRSSKKRAYKITMAKGKNAERVREKNYKELLKIQREVCIESRRIWGIISENIEIAKRFEVMVILEELAEVIELAEQVYDQAERRIIKGEQVPANEKLFSLFETHTDIICRGKKGSKVEFGHKVDFATGRSGLVLRYEVYKGNPGDGEVLKRAIEDHVKLFGKVPDKLTADRRYFSFENENMLKGEGVREVGIPKPGRLSEIRKSLQKAKWFKKLMRIRAGIEGNLSTLLRSYGLKRCLWKGWESFKAYVGAGVMTYNLRLLAGHLSKV